MCKNREENKCKVTDDICPWVFWCGTINAYKEREGMDKYCKYKKQSEIPEGYNKVEFERHGRLYVTINGQTFKMENPYNYIPQYVKVYKYKGDWKIKKELNENDS